MDAHAGRQTGMGQAEGRTVKAIYADAYQRHGLRSIETGSSFAAGSDDVGARTMQVRNWLAPKADQGPKLRFMKDTTVLTQANFNTYKKRVVKKETDDIPIVRGADLMVVLEYAVADNPTWIEPKRSENVWSPAYRAFRRWQSKENQNNGRDHVNFGSPLQVA
jgi:hypothetical protein